MAVDGADDENDAKPKSAEAGSPRSGTEPRTEWTASDERGPLHQAGDDPSGPPHDVEAGEASGSPREASSVAAMRSEPIDAEGATPEPLPAAATPRGEAAQPRRSFWPIAAGLIVGAAIGAGSAAIVYTYQQGDTSTDQRVAGLASRLDALEKRPDPQPTVTSLKAAVADLDQKVAAVQKSAGAAQAARATSFEAAPLQQKIAALQSSVDAIRAQAGDVKSLDSKVAGLATGVAAMQRQSADVKSLASDMKGLEGRVAGLATAVDGTRQQGSKAQASIESLQTNQKTLEGKITSAPSLAVVADSLVQQIDQGQPYASQVDALTSLGADPAKIAVLRENAAKGVPSAKTLATKFEPLAEPIAAVAHRAPPNAGLMERLKSGMLSMVSIRRADDVSGDDLASRVARIQADLAREDVGAAFATWDALPTDAKAKSEAWGALAKTHAEAMNAARALQQQAITALGTKKS